MKYFYHSFLEDRAYIERYGAKDDSIYEGNKKKNERYNQIIIHDFINADNFIVELTFKNSTDEMFLAKIPSNSTLQDTYNDVLGRIAKKNIYDNDSLNKLAVPYVRFKIREDVDEVKGAFKNDTFAGRSIGTAVQYIDFNMDENGVTLESLAMMVECLSADLKTLYFDKPFLIVLKEKEAIEPYFLMWVQNSEFMEK